ncbi:hypothetical protein B0920_17350 [Massilia sp. KIM]|uniref:TadE/TadG family type IV pilus assembly protein n=1 Tax=Massilia sp. KIM TaxID=1955422 RepID=UPI00098FAC83|nr:TadE/TadG family type IV pilus assembly protein [Massilia sp. KIM]OON60727.1 hypothetical protein B0920_17350 [Massilia sp. KIM]
MSDDKDKPVRRIHVLRTRQRGVGAVEFALVAIVFFSLVFVVIEVARAVYLFNTLQEVTRRAAAEAANSGFDQASIDRIRATAIFSNSSGNLILGDPVTPQHLKIEYLSLAQDPDTGALAMQPASPMPSCPARNYLNCLANPYDSSCIRLVRVRICQPGGGTTCSAVPYRTMVPLVDLSGLQLPQSTTIVPAQTLGRTFGSLPCE